MSNCPHLPQWVSYFQALGVPLAALIVTLLGVWIAARQMLIANEKVALDRFNSQYDRRFAVYEATRAILAQVFHGKPSDADTRSYGLRVLEARFLFNEEMFKYLGEVRQHIDALRLIDSQSENASEEERAAYQDMELSHGAWITNQGWDYLTGIRRFEPFLKYVAPIRPWLLRWP
jgi:hypothetical protein